MQDNIISHKNINLQTKALLAKVRGLRLSLSLYVACTTIVLSFVVWFVQNNRALLSTPWGIALLSLVVLASIASIHSISLLSVGLVTRYEQNTQISFWNLFASQFKTTTRFALLLIVCEIIALGSILLIVPFFILLPILTLAPVIMLVVKSGYISSVYAVFTKISGNWMTFFVTAVRLYAKLLLRILIVWILSIIVEISLPFAPLKIISTLSILAMLLATIPYYTTYTFIVSKTISQLPTTPVSLWHKVVMYISLVLGIALLLLPLFVVIYILLTNGDLLWAGAPVIKAGIWQ